MGKRHTHRQTKTKTKTKAKRMQGGGEYASVEAPSTIQPSLQWNTPHTKVPPPAYNGGLYGGVPFAGPWGAVPVPATTGYHINKNLVSAEPPPMATTHYPGTERLGNNYTGMPGVNWYAKEGIGPYNIKCTTNQSGGGSTLHNLIQNAEHISNNSSKVRGGGRKRNVSKKLSRRNNQIGGN